MNFHFRILAGALLIVTLAGALLVGGTVFSQHSEAAHPIPTVDPQLILHPQTFITSAAIQRQGRITLRVYPAIPGAQRLQLSLPARDRMGVIGLAFSMPGMPMPVVRVRLIGRHGVYRGRVTLPMFGRYLVMAGIGRYAPVALQVVLGTPLG